MAYQHSRSHGESGSARHSHIRHHNDSHSVPHTRDERSTPQQAIAYPSYSPSRRSGAANDGLHDHSHSYDASDTDSDRNEHFYHQQQYDSRHQERSRYHDGQRSWQSFNSDLDSVVNNAAVREAIRRLEGRSQMHSRTVVRQQRPIPAENHRHQAHSSEWYEQNSRPLGRSNLRELNRDRGSTHATRRWMDEDQRAGPYDNVGQVSRRSDYDRRVSHRRDEEYEQYQQDNEYEYDDRSNTLN